MMNSKEYPNVIVEIDKTDFLSIIGSRFQQKLYMKLTFAGISNSIITEYMIHENSDGKIKLQGLTKVKLSDFKLTHPKKSTPEKIVLIKTFCGCNSNFNFSER